MKADPCVVDLHKLAQFFFEFGMNLCLLKHRESAEISSVLVEVCDPLLIVNVRWRPNS